MLITYINEMEEIMIRLDKIEKENREFRDEISENLNQDDQDTYGEKEPKYVNDFIYKLRETCSKRGHTYKKCEIYPEDLQKYVSSGDRHNFGEIHCHSIESGYGPNYYICDNCERHLRNYYDQNNKD